MTNYKNIFKGLQHLTMTAEQKARGRAALQAYVAAHPAPIQKPVRSFFFTYQSMSTVAFLLVLVLGTGTSYAAEFSLPGDLLYPIKVTLNEEVRAALTTDQKERALWEVERAERRITEAAQLAAAGKLDERTREELDQQIEVHTAQALAYQGEFAAADADIERSTHIETRLALASEARDRIVRGIRPTATLLAVAPPQPALLLEESPDTSPTIAVATMSRMASPVTMALEMQVAEEHASDESYMEKASSKQAPEFEPTQVNRVDFVRTKALQDTLRSRTERFEIILKQNESDEYADLVRDAKNVLAEALDSADYERLPALENRYRQILEDILKAQEHIIDQRASSIPNTIIELGDTVHEEFFKEDRR